MKCLVEAVKGVLVYAAAAVIAPLAFAAGYCEGLVDGVVNELKR